MNLQWARFLIPGGLFMLAGSLIGCADPDAIGKTVPVTGKVTIGDKLLETGAVNYLPDNSKGNKGLGATGVVTNGSYTLETQGKSSVKAGALPGFYKVTITTSVPGGMATTPVGEPKKDAAPAGAPGGTPIASKYTNYAGTPITIEVKEGAPETWYDLKATSK
jgi:hypothetical protein